MIDKLVYFINSIQKVKFIHYANKLKAILFKVFVSGSFDDQRHKKLILCKNI